MIYIKAATVLEKKKVSHHELNHTRTSQQEEKGGVVSMLSESRGGRQEGPGMGEICLVPAGERVTNRIQAPSVVPVKSVSFSSSALAKFYSGLPGGTFPGKDMPRASGQCWLLYPAPLPLKIHALGLGWRNQSLVGSWGDW